MKHYKHSEGTAIIRLIPNKFNYSTYAANVSKTLLNFEDFHLLTFWDDLIIKEKLQMGELCRINLRKRIWILT